jgi:hypothetical protein
MNMTITKTNEDKLALTQRWAGLLILVGMLLLFGFFVLQQTSNTGFFTTKFGILEMVCLYGPIVISLIAPIFRAIGGYQNPSRPFDAATSLSLAMGSFWLWIVFPFDFAHLGDVLPSMFRIVTSLITNDIGKILLILQFVGGPITALFTILKYLSVRRQTVLI